MTTLHHLSNDRDNNLNLMRLLAAFGVLVSHAWPIALGEDAVQPMSVLTGYTLGSICVFIFFVVSGFLIAGSFVNARSLTHFTLARILRLVPGLVVSLLLVMLLLGPAVTTLGTAAYFGHPDTWTFLVRNTLLAFPQYTLPGVFVDNPYPTVEGSIWTLIHEVVCYSGVFVAGILGLLHRRSLATLLLGLYVLACLVSLEMGLIDHPRLRSFSELSQYFAIGMIAFLWRDRLPMSLPLGVGLIVVAVLLRDTVFWGAAFAFALSYAVFWLGFVPGGMIRAYNRVGDYSYGLYIYAFPIQGLVVWMFGAGSPLMNILWAAPLTLIPSILSWHLIEKPALSSRKKLAEYLMRGRAEAGEPS